MRSTFGYAGRRDRPTLILRAPGNSAEVVTVPYPAPAPGIPPREQVYEKELFAPIELDPEIRRHLTPVKYEGKSDLQGRVNKVLGWNTWGMERRMAFLRMLVTDTAKDPAIARKAVSILREGNAPVRDYKREWAVLLRWVQQNVRYVNEPGERLATSQYTLTELHGDCDDMAILLASLGESIRLPWAFVLSGRHKKSGRKVCWVEGSGPCTPGVEWSHIYLRVGGPPFRPTWWTFAEPTLDVPLGWNNVTSAPVKDRPDLGTEAAVPTDAGVSARGTAASSGLLPASMRIASSTANKTKEFAGKIAWPTVIGTVIASVLSFVVVQKVVAPRLGVTVGVTGGAGSKSKRKSR